ncbi:MAG TPA: hypothetical protein VIZ68_06760 [Thermoplasmata archaeon]
MSDGYWAVRAAETISAGQSEVQTYLRQEWPGETAGWILSDGTPIPPPRRRPAPGSVLSRVLHVLRGPRTGVEPPSAPV